MIAEDPLIKYEKKTDFIDKVTTYMKNFKLRSIDNFLTILGFGLCVFLIVLLVISLIKGNHIYKL